MASLTPALLLLPLLFDAPVAAPVDPQTIAGGEPVVPCGWPSVVLLRGNGYLCSGNLIHPEIVATAAHCIAVMEPDTRVYFGDTANTSYDKVEVEYCTGSPDFVDNGDGTIPFSEVQHDWGFCKLAEPITDVEPIPPIYGCEMDLVVPGAEIVRVGFGKETLATNQFYKRWVETTIVDVPYTGANGWPTQLSEGGGGEGTCPGDSGGPAFIRVPENAGGDGSWRMLAIQSTQPIEDGNGDPIECGTEPNNTAVIAQGIEFIEAQSGVDVTPCFDVAGGWNPAFECGGFPLDPGAGEGHWPNNCELSVTGEFSGACGDTYDQINPDLAAPSVEIVDPAGVVMEPFAGEPVVVHVLAEADDGDGWGVSHVELAIIDVATNTELARFTDETEPYSWDPSFPKGEYLIQAFAFDNAGQEAQTDTVSIYIGVEPPAGDDTGTGSGGGDTGEDPEGSTGLSSGTSGDAGDDTTTGETPDATTGQPPDTDGDPGTAPEQSDDDSGCGCRHRGTGTPASMALLLLALSCLRRRR